LQPVPIDWSQIGAKVERVLPSGPVAFTRGGDEVIGGYDALSLHSPVTRFASQEMARREAEIRLDRLLAPPVAASKAAERLESPGRRAFLRGQTSGS
jgi:[NiFe] hydrogenase assembly HybE family chaperone